MAPRHAITLEQRQKLRRWAHHQHPKPTQRRCIEWFLQEYNHRLSQSTISESLSSHFSYLDDTDTPSRGKGKGQRQREGHWPDLERVLFTWQRRIQARGGFISGEILQQKAKVVWSQLPQYSNLAIPEFSTGWLEGFKRRWHIKSRIRRGESSSLSIQLEENMIALETGYDMDDDEVLQQVILETLGTQSLQFDEETPAKPVPTVQEAIKALHTLIDYAESLDSVSTIHIRALERLASEIEGNER